ELLAVARAIPVKLTSAQVHRPNGVTGDNRRAIGPGGAPGHAETRAVDAQGDEAVAAGNEEHRRGPRRASVSPGSAHLGVEDLATGPTQVIGPQQVPHAFLADDEHQPARDG